MCKTRTISEIMQNKKYVPGLKVAGNYMKKLDFDFGDKVELRTDTGIILITKQEAIDKLTARNPRIKDLIDSLDLI